MVIFEIFAANEGGLIFYVKVMFRVNFNAKTAQEGHFAWELMGYHMIFMRVELMNTQLPLTCINMHKQDP